MNKCLTPTKQNFLETELASVLLRYQLLPQFLKEQIIDAAIANISCTPEETAIAWEKFSQRNQLHYGTKQKTWQQQYGLTMGQLESMAVRSLKIEKFKKQQWNHKLKSYFLQRKTYLDRVVYSLLRVQDKDMAQELYFRIQEGEQSFAELAQQYSEGPEAYSGGIKSLCELGTIDPTIAKLLEVSQPGQLHSPIQIGNWFLILRLEKLVSAQLDDFMRQRLLTELFENWLQEETIKVLRSDRRRCLLSQIAFPSTIGMKFKE